MDFFLEGVEVTARGAVETARRLVNIFDADMRRMQQAASLLKGRF